MPPRSAGPCLQTPSCKSEPELTLGRNLAGLARPARKPVPCRRRRCRCSCHRLLAQPSRACVHTHLPPARSLLRQQTDCVETPLEFQAAWEAREPRCVSDELVGRVISAKQVRLRRRPACWLAGWQPQQQATLAKRQIRIRLVARLLSLAGMGPGPRTSQQAQAASAAVNPTHPPPPCLPPTTPTAARRTS